jgi:hypothetical protein
LRLAAEYPNISGFVLDDFLHGSADSPPDPWLAANGVRFSVSLVLTPPAPVAVDRMTLVQTSWHSGDYRSGAFAVDPSDDGKSWREVHRDELPNAASAKVDFRPGEPERQLREAPRSRAPQAYPARVLPVRLRCQQADERRSDEAPVRTRPQVASTRRHRGDDLLGEQRMRHGTAGRGVVAELDQVGRPASTGAARREGPIEPRACET